jgi:uncharacterized phage-associated protein
MITSEQAAEYFLGVSEPEYGDIVSNLKLQKLVYYAQGFHLAIYDKPLFDEPIVKWEHGPVVESLYHEYKKYSSNAIPVPKAVDTSIFSDEQKELLNEVFEVYGQFSAWKLRCMTHEEPPWKQAPTNGIIDLELMKEYFKTQLANG